MGMLALQEFQRQRPDLVVLDWVLPELNGLEVLRRIRKVSGGAGADADRPRRPDRPGAGVGGGRG